jgi:hypothetical protein
MQRGKIAVVVAERRLPNACRYDGAVSMVSTVALMVLYSIFGSLAQFGIRPHRKVSKVRCLVFGLSRTRRRSAPAGLTHTVVVLMHKSRHAVKRDG